MTVIVNVTRQRRNKEYYKELSNPLYSYSTTSPGTPAPPPVGVGTVEKGRLENIPLHAVSINFSAPFTVVPIVTDLKVYRWILLAPGNYQKQDVLYKYTSTTPLSVIQLLFEIDASESLTGVIVEYVIQ